MRLNFSFLSVYLISLFLFLGELSAQSGGLVRIRDANPSRVNCGLYLSSLFDSTMGERISDLDEESLRESFENLNLEPRLIYVDRKTGKTFKSAKDFKEALAAGTARAIVDRPALFIVGTPHFGPGNGDVPRRGEAKKLVESLLAEFFPDKDIALKNISRPVYPEFSDKDSAMDSWMMPIEAGLYGAQRAYDILPLAQNYQTPHRGEVESMVAKLIIANGVQQLILMSSQSMGPAIFGGAVNYANSAATGGYRKFISNWFNAAQSRDADKKINVVFNAVDDLVRKTLLTSFFTVELWWSSALGRALFQSTPEDWDRLGRIGSLGGWGEVFVAKASAIVFSVFWRNYYYKAILGWEARMEGEGRKEDARRTAGRFELIGTLIATPSYLFASMAKDAYKVLGVVEFSPSHAVMLGVGGMFASLYVAERYMQNRMKNGVKIPVSNFGKWRHRAGWRVAQALSMDPWVDRFDKIHSGVRWGFTKVGRAASFGYRYSGLGSVADWLERKAREYFEQKYKDREQYENELSYNFDIRQLIDLDPGLEKLIAEDPEILDLIKDDPDFQRLVKNDEHFKSLRVEISKMEERSH